MLAATADLHYARFLGFLAVLTTEFASLFGRAIARPVRTLASRFFSHEKPPRRFKESGVLVLGDAVALC